MKMRLLIPCLIVLSATSFAQDAPTPVNVTTAPEIKTVGPVRYQICVAPWGGVNQSSMPIIIKIDTQTGESWIFQTTSDKAKAEGVPCVWNYIPITGHQPQ
jgi:hypothetical protein